jgi:exodeoxyribonuclease VIII
MNPGLHRNVPAADYFAFDAISSSTLREFARSPLHAHYRMTHPKESAAMDLGTGAHTAILEPARFGAEYVQGIKVDRRTTVGKTAWAKFLSENVGKGILSADEYEQATGMRDAVWAHPLASAILGSPGPCEVVAVWEFDSSAPTDPMSWRHLCKARIDKLAKWEGTTVADIKTTRDAREWAFSRDVVRYGYHIQAAWYLDGLAALAPLERRWVWIVLEQQPPHGVMVYEATSGLLEQGRHEYEKYMRLYLECKASGNWPGYPVGLTQLPLPAYAMTPEEWEVGA